MNIGELETRLREKERELVVDMARAESEAREARVAEVEDRVDGSISSESKESLFQQTTFDWNLFTQVRDALQRIENGIRKMCRLWAPARLHSIPWTAYCLADEERHDREGAAQAL